MVSNLKSSTKSLSRFIMNGLVFKILFSESILSTTKSPGALAPKLFIPMTLPSIPTYLCQPSGDAFR